MPIKFDGKAYAAKKEAVLKALGKSAKVVSFVFQEDPASLLYTRLKHAAAARVEVEYLPVFCSLKDPLDKLAAQIKAASDDPKITGVMIQKPTKTIFNNQFSISSEFSMTQLSNYETWWETLVGAIDPHKDVDGLVPGSGVIPATVKAILSILKEASVTNVMSVAILGRSDIVGKPLYEILKAKHAGCDLFGKTNMPEKLLKYDVVISAVGSPDLVTGDMIKSGVILVDVGSPVGDIAKEANAKASFYTPVPGGVGPVTVVSLLENCLRQM